MSDIVQHTATSGEEIYLIPPDPTYNPDIRKLQNSDPANADLTFNPLVQQLVENAHALYLDKVSKEPGKGLSSEDFTAGEKEKLSTAAPLDSPAFTGTPTVPSPTAADNSTAIASTAFVKGQGYQTEEQVRGIVGELEYDPVGSAQAVQGNLDAHTANSSSHITAGERTAWNGKASPSAQVDATLLTYEWAGSGPYTQTVAVSGLGAAQNGMIGLAQSATQAQREAARDAMLSVTAQASGSLTVTADGDKPGVNIPVTITRLG